MSSWKRLPFLIAPALLAGCGIERVGNLGRNESPRPASAIAGTTYFIVVDGFAGASGAYELQVTCP